MKKESKTKERISNTASVVVVLDNIRSVFNVGSIFRTADGAGVDEILLAGVTPAPIDRFGRKRKDLAKVALGAEESVKWRSFADTKEAVDFLKKNGYKIVAVEQDKNSVNYKGKKAKGKTAFIFGEETKGMSKEILGISDEIYEIPMRGNKESLNVSVAVGIILFECL